MKRRLLWAALGLALVVAVVATGCSLFTGKEGKAYLTVNTASSSTYAAVSAGIGFPNNWSLATAYPVNTGAWNYYYAQAYYYGYMSAYLYPYWYVVNTTSNIFAFSSYVSSVQAAYAAVNNGYYYDGSISISVNKGAFLKDGADRYYTLTLAWNKGDTTITYKGLALKSTTLTEDSEKTVKEFSSDYDTITLTINKTAVAGPVPANMNTCSSGSTSPITDFKLIQK